MFALPRPFTRADNKAARRTLTQWWGPSTDTRAMRSRSIQLFLMRELDELGLDGFVQQDPWTLVEAFFISLSVAREVENRRGGILHQMFPDGERTVSVISSLQESARAYLVA